MEDREDMGEMVEQVVMVQVVMGQVVTDQEVMAQVVGVLVTDMELEVGMISPGEAEWMRGP